MRPWILFLVLITFGGDVSAQSAGVPSAVWRDSAAIQVDRRLLKNEWPARWIQCPGTAARAYGIYHFRKTFSLSSVPARFIVHVSADNRYRLWVNGHPVCSGPARGDLGHWNFETTDIAPYLTMGKNTLAALVWNMGEWAPVAQVSNQSGFLMQGDTKADDSVNTNSTWAAYHDTAYHPCSTDNGQRLQTYMVVGPGDSVLGSAYPWGWEQPGYPDSTWTHARTVTNAVTDGNGTDNLWTLSPRTIPLFPEKMQRLSSLRRSSGIQADDSFLDGKHPLTVPAGSAVTLLLDQSFNTLAYPELLVSGGQGATVRLSYAEALVDSLRQKGDRGDIEGKSLIGNYDIFTADGGADRLFRPLWQRTYRYLQVDIHTGSQALIIEDLYGMRTGYPFERRATFAASDTSLRSIWEVGWRTALLCAGETYYDCPYYEQLQYEGDTRIQSLISLYVTGDDRLMRKAITDFYHSRVPEGLTQGRYPSSRLQVIPTFSLFWVSMLHDYWMHRSDSAFLEPMLLPAEEVLHWYEQHIDTRMHMLGPMPWWSFVDWNDAFPGGVPDGATDGNSSVVTLQYVYTLKQASELFDYFHKTAEAAHYKALANELNKGVYEHCFDKSRMLMANTPKRNSYSQHASILAVLSGALTQMEAQKVMPHVLADAGVSQATFYFRFYLTRALVKAGMANLYYEQLKPWRDMLALGLTTFSEKPDPTRSDCHAWSASPLYDFLATICGIRPDGPGFQKVLVEPALGPLTEVSASMPHPAGMISVHLKRIIGQFKIIGEQAGKMESIDVEITLPPGVSGRFKWSGKVVQLHGGHQVFTLSALTLPWQEGGI